MVEKDGSSGTKRRQLVKMAGVAGAGLAGVGSASASGGKQPKVEFPSKKRIVVHVPGHVRKGNVAFGYLVRKKLGNQKWAGISLKWFKPGDAKRKNGIKVSRTKKKIVAEANAPNWYAYKAKGKVKGKKFSEERSSYGGGGGKPKKPDCTIRFHDNCRRVRVTCDEEVTVKAYTKKEHKWGGKVIEKKTKTFDWTLQKEGNYFTKVKVYYKGKKIAAKKCDRERPKKPKPECEIKFYENCRRATVTCDKKVTVKAYTKKEHKWGGHVIEKETKEFDWTLQKEGNYFTKVRVYYKDEKIAEKECDRERPKKPKVECDAEKATVKNVPKKLREGTIAVKAEKKRSGKTDWQGFSLQWFKPGQHRNRKSIKAKRKGSKVVIRAKSGWKLELVKGDVKGHEFSKKCKKDDDDDDDGDRPRVKCDRKKAAVRVPDSCRKGNVTVKAKKGHKTDWQGFSLQWFKPGQHRNRKSVKAKRKNGKVLIHAKPGWKLELVKGNVKGKKFRKQCEGEHDEDDCEYDH